MLKTVNYDARQHVGYISGRDLGREHALAWAEVFKAHAPAHRPLSVLDLGCGAGRFTAVLAESFGGDVLGVEPSERMRGIAIEQTASPHVSFQPGRAEAIPTPDDAFDLILMFLSFHHVVDRETAAAEIVRVLRPGGRVIIRSQFADRFPDVSWHAYFPRARDIELQMFPSLQDVEAIFNKVGLHRVALVEFQERFADSLAMQAERLRHRAISTFDHLDDHEIEDGFARLADAVAIEKTPTPVIARSDVLVLG